MVQIDLKGNLEGWRSMHSPDYHSNWLINVLSLISLHFPTISHPTLRLLKGVFDRLHFESTAHLD